MSDYHAPGYKISLQVRRYQVAGVYRIKPGEIKFLDLCSQGISRVGSSRISWGSPARATAPRAPMTPLPP